MPISQNVRDLVEAVAASDMERSRNAAICVVVADKTKGNAAWRNRMIGSLEARMLGATDLGRILPADIQGILVFEEEVPELAYRRYELTRGSREAISRMKVMHRVAGKLAELGINETATTLLYGESGCGKTTLARMAAYEMSLPFAYINLSNLIGSLLGQTASNLAKCFKYVRDVPCVLLLDEIDAIALSRSDGSSSADAEMNRVTITLMQELDRLPSTVCVIAATNRPDVLDKAVKRRFANKYEITRCQSADEAMAIAETFLDTCEGYAYDFFDNPEFLAWQRGHEGPWPTQASVVHEVVEALARHIAANKPLEDEIDIRWEAMR